MKNLIVNADDLGADEGRNAGILEAVAAGAVKSVSLLANAPATGRALEAVRGGKFAGVSLGIHLNLSEGRPVSAGLSLLSGENGFFLGKTAAQRLLLSENRRDLEAEVLREVNAQIEGVLREKMPLDHLDGHQHLHVFPAVRKAAAAAAGKYGIPWFRLPREPVPISNGEPIPENLKAEGKLFSDLAAETARLLAGTEIRTPAHFRGLYLKGRLTAGLLEKCLRELPGGVTELMVHPGRPLRGGGESPFSGFSTKEREKELEALISPLFRRAAEKTGVRLISFAEAGP